MKHIKNKITIIAIFSLWSCFSQNKKDFSAVKHVVVIGFDGLSPNGIEKAKTPNFDKLIKEGASTLHARSVLPSSSSTNWASMIMGAGPEQHGITSNDWEKNNFVLPAVVQGEDFLFPTIFKLIHTQIKNAEVGAIYHWSGFGRLFEKSAVTYDINPETEDQTALKASNYIKAKQPVFTFVHFDHVDHAGHEYGHGSAEYYKAVEKADALLGEVMLAITSSAMAGETVVIVSSDHGGLGKGHGGESLQEVEIPFIVWGKTVKKNYTIDFPVYQYDNAATVAFALGLKMPMACIGRPVKNAFEGYNEKDNYPLVKRFKEPVILPKAVLSKRAGGLFTSQAEVVIENPDKEGEIRYTIDGSMPSGKSLLYKSSFKTDKNTVVKSAIFKNGSIASLVSEAFFRIIPAGFQPPVSYEIFYLSNLNSIPFLDNLIPNEKGNCFEISSEEINQKIKDNTAVRFKTTIMIEKEGVYKFYTRSDDGSILKVNNEVVANNDGDHGIIEKSGEIKLKSGVYPLEVLWFNGGGGGWLDVYYETAGIPKQIIPSSIFKQ
ncbi:alkaline phosphatase family protein [Flavobacterium pectinovorum]|uniref:alkaline phosphatase family protein n=1 Tax=Flavobacterium pectinovorum TaxID=29533 RepID=UPI0026601C17|nr:alkaline phosphatase family protein [Flavobacterium pectinovorum]WKL49236.1 alkaline phosphatase family protein [Flavobacterium pectinovorum]